MNLIKKNVIILTLASTVLSMAFSIEAHAAKPSVKSSANSQQVKEAAPSTTPGAPTALSEQAPPSTKVIELLPLKEEASHIEFSAVGRPSLLKIKGKGDGPEGSMSVSGNKVNGTLVVDLSTLKTGISMRDSHMKEKYLHTEKFPQAKLSLKDLVLPSTWSLANPTLEETPFSGTLLLHGVEKPVTGTFKTKPAEGGKATQIVIEAKLDLKLSDFAIDIPSYAGITVADQVLVTVNVLTAVK